MFHPTNCNADPKEQRLACPVPPQLTNEQWLPIRAAVALGQTHGNASKACSGFCVVALAGMICLVRFRRTRLAGGASPSGRWMECGIEPGLDY